MNCLFPKAIKGNFNVDLIHLIGKWHLGDQTRNLLTKRYTEKALEYENFKKSIGNS
jgi:hypothetical protein